jgi:hypothetical protein
MRAVVGAAAVLTLVARLPAAAAEPVTQTSVFKGHQLVTSIDQLTRHATIELDDRQISAKEGVAEIGKINTIDLQTSILYFLRIKTTAQCASYMMIRVPLVGDSGKSEVLSDFGACNDQLTVQIDSRQGWAAWYAVAFRNDRATAQVALMVDDKLTTREVKAPPCLFLAPVQPVCLYAVMAEAAGSGELGLPTGSGSFADNKITTFLNRTTGKATVKLNDHVLRTFDNAKEFYLASVEGEDQFGLFVFFLKPGTGCTTRPLAFFAARATEPNVITDFGPCTDQMVRLMLRKANAIQWSGIAYRSGAPTAYIASVADQKLSTRTTLLPACMMNGDKAKESSCVLQALGASGPAPSQPPQLRVVPTPPPTASHRAPRSTLGI